MTIDLFVVLQIVLVFAPGVFAAILESRAYCCNIKETAALVTTAVIGSVVVYCWLRLARECIEWLLLDVTYIWGFQ